MADNKQKQNRDPLSAIDAAVNEKMNQWQQQRQLEELKERSAALDAKIEELAEKTADFTLEYGADDFRAQMMMAYLEVAIEMKEAVKMIQGANDAIAFIYEAVDFIDESMNVNSTLQKQSLKSKYGLFSRIKNRILNRRVARNNINRVNQMMDKLVAQRNIAQNVMDSLRRACARMTKAIEKSNIKRQKKLDKEAQKQGKPLALSKQSTAEKLVAAIIASKSGAESAAVTEGSAPAAAGAAPSDVSDISDIT